MAGAAALRLIRRTALALAGLVLAYPLAGWLFAMVPRGGAEAAPASGGVEIMVETNGIHTGIVMPLIHPLKDWRATFPDAAAPRPDGERPTHIAIGWGEREIFLHVAQWDDLPPLTALRIATLGGDTLLRVSPYVRPAPGPSHRPLRLNAAQYARLVRGIEAALAMPAGTLAIRGSYSSDLYYPAHGRYHPVHTCNVWVGNRLAEAGVAMGWWTPFAGGVMRWVPQG